MNRGCNHSADHREAIKNGWSIDPSLLYDDDPFENVSSICSKCGNGGPAQYGRGFHCNQCGHDWKDIRYWRDDPSIPTCQMSGGETLHWDEGRGFWVDLVSGETYPPGDDPLRT